MALPSTGTRSNGAIRWRRWAVKAGAGGVVVVVAANVVIYAGMALARLLGQDQRLHDPLVPSVQHLRTVDRHLLVGDQPTPGGYRGLVERYGVKVVVNLRTGDGPDPLGDDPGLLRQLGVEYVRLPVHDGHAPDAATVRRFLETVESAPGPVYAHCGGGVGRSSVMEAAYRASKGQESAVLDQLFLGPLSLEQLWFVATVGKGRTTARSRAVQVASRVIDFPRPYFSWMAREFR